MEERVEEKEEFLEFTVKLGDKVVTGALPRIFLNDNENGIIRDYVDNMMYKLREQIYPYIGHLVKFRMNKTLFTGSVRGMESTDIVTIRLMFQHKEDGSIDTVIDKTFDFHLEDEIHDLELKR